MEEEKLFDEQVIQDQGPPADDAVQPTPDPEAEAAEAGTAPVPPPVDEEPQEEAHEEPREEKPEEQQEKPSPAAAAQPVPPPPPAPQPGPDHLGQIDQRLDGIATTQQRLFTEVREMHKLYHSEFAGRLKSMQDELEQYRKIDKGRAFDDILGAIARIYGNNETLADEVEDPKAKKSIKYLLLDLEDLLEAYGMSALRSAVGDKRNPRHCQIMERVPTDDPAKHDTVARSYNTGFYIGNRTVIKEMVDIFFYEGGAAPSKSEDSQTEGSGEEPISE